MAAGDKETGKYQSKYPVKIAGRIGSSRHQNVTRSGSVVEGFHGGEHLDI